MTPGLLTPEEISRVTGYERPADQVRFLRKNGVPHTVNRKGEPVLTWAAIHAWHGLQQTPAADDSVFDFAAVSASR